MIQLKANWQNKNPEQVKQTLNCLT